MLVTAATAQDSLSYSVAQALDFRPGNAKARAMLARIPELSDVVSERFGVALVDFDDDGRDEIAARKREQLMVQRSIRSPGRFPRYRRASDDRVRAPRSESRHTAPE